jgi:antitoxin component of MazEF toxin-antitoxin module
MTNLVVERDSLVKMLEEWLNELQIESSDRLEVKLSTDQMTIRPQTAENIELDKWLDQVTRKYDSVLRRLAVS